MIDELIKAISKRLKEKIPEIPHRYPYNPPQNFEEPCFIIRCENVDNKDLLTLRFQKEIAQVSYLFSVTLLNPRDNKLLDDIVPRVLFALKWLYLEDGRPVLTLNRVAHPVDDTQYSFTFRVEREQISKGEIPPLMEELEENIGVENE